MWSWLSFLVGLMLGTPIALIIFAFLFQEPQCHCCPSYAMVIREMDGVEYHLCFECAKEFDRVKGGNKE